MKALLIGLGNIGLGLIVPVFEEAGYELLGTDANHQRLVSLRGGYWLKIPNDRPRLIKFPLSTLEQVKGDFDLVITSVGRRHLPVVAEWYQRQQLSVPVLLAENLPDPVEYFPRQLPIVIDRICPRVETADGTLSAIAEAAYQIVVLDDPVTHQLGELAGVTLLSSPEAVERYRQQKMFTVNTAHVLVALYGQELGYTTVEEAVLQPAITKKIRAAMAEVGPWLGLTPDEAKKRSAQILARFSSPLQDPLKRILGPDNHQSARRYLELPVKNLRAMDKPAPILEAALSLL